MKELIIIGAGDFGREVFSLAQQSLGYETEFVIKGYLDASYDKLDGFTGYPPIIGILEDYMPTENDVFVCSISNTEAKKRCIDAIESKGGNFINIIHKTCLLNHNVKIGKGIIMGHTVSLGNDTVLKDHIVLNSTIIIGHDVLIGSYCHLNAFAFMGGFSKLGNGCTMHPHSVLLPKVTVGDNSIIGVGSVVMKNVKADKTVFGNPAKEIM